MAAPDRAATFAPGVRRALPVLLAQRLVLNIGGRMVLTYLPNLAAGTGLSVEAMSRAVFARDLTGALGPWMGRVVRRRGAWTVMTVAGFVAASGMALVLTGPAGLGVGLVVWGVSRTTFLVASASWIGDVVRYERRGRATGLVELTWAAAALIGLPLCGLLIGAFGWWAAPLAMTAIGTPLALWSLVSEVPDGGRGAGPAGPASRGRFRRSTLTALTAITLMMSAAQFLFFAHGLWLADTYGLDATGVAFAIVVVGAAEATASLGTIRLTDLVGKRTAVLGGTALLAAATATFAAVPAPPLALGLGLLIAAFLGSEFAIVSGIPLTSELEPANRSAVIGLGTGMATAARATVSLIAGWTYVRHGFQVTMAIASVTAVAAAIILAARVTEPGATSGS